MDVLALSGRVFLSVVFGVAAVTKALDGVAWRRAIGDFGVPPSLVRTVAVLLPAVELGVAVLLLSTRSATWGALGALMLLLLFSVAIAVNLLRGREPECRCFGQVRSVPISSRTLARNAGLASYAAFIVWAGTEAQHLSVHGWLMDITGMGMPTLVIAAGVVGLLAGETALLWHMFRQHGRLLLRMDRVERDLGMSLQPGEPGVRISQGLPVGSEAPGFAVATALRSTVWLEDLLLERKPAVLIFSDHSCPACSELLPQIGKWQKQYASQLRMAVVSRSSDHTIRRMAERDDIRDVLLQQDGEIADMYAVTGTPAAVLIHPDGTIGSSVKVGREEIEALVRLAAESGEAHVRSEVAEASA
jgi:methylamine utilization protein MauE/AhpC/TSA family protein